MIKAIAAVGQNFELGKNNGLLFYLPNDMQIFKKLTEHNFVVCGSNTLLSFPNGKPLKNRTTIVLCSATRKFNDCIMYHDKNKLVHDLSIISKEHDVYIIGGATIYKELLPYCDEVILTKVVAEDKEATVFFPNIDENNNFEIIRKEPYLKDGEYLTQLVVYSKKRN